MGGRGEDGRAPDWHTAAWAPHTNEGGYAGGDLMEDSSILFAKGKYSICLGFF